MRIFMSSKLAEEQGGINKLRLLFAMFFVIIMPC